MSEPGSPCLELLWGAVVRAHNRRNTALEPGLRRQTLLQCEGSSCEGWEHGLKGTRVGSNPALLPALVDLEQVT